MTDLAPLHLRLRRALDLSSLLVLGALAPACASTQEQDSTQSKTEVAKPDATKTDPTKTKTDPDATNPDATNPDPDATKTDPKPELTITPTHPQPELPRPDPDMNLPRCPTIEWCAPKPLAESMRPTDTGATITDVEGCPGSVHREKLDPKKLAGNEPPPAGTMDWAGIAAEATKAKRTAGDGTSCCYEWTIPCPGGRPLLVDGRPWIAGLRAGRSWSAQLPETTSTSALPDALRERIADAWLRDALTEHASIASFARAHAELEAIAAPAELLRACERAAEDEVEHARLCFALAERFSGQPLEPTALPSVAPRGGDAVAVALDTFVEGCVGETIAAACARRAAALATDPVVRAVLQRIADDETEHAALAWRTIAWLTKRDGLEVLESIAELAHELRPQPSTEHADEPDAAQLHAHGRLDARTLAQTRALAWREIVDPLLVELGADMPLEPRTRVQPS